MQKKHRIFVYGSLRRGESYHHLLETAIFEAPARTPARYVLLDLGWYPGLITGGTTAITGEVFTVSDALRAQLDRYEDHPHLFERQVIVLEDGSEAEAYVYVAGVPPHARPVPSGDWCRRAKP